MARLDGEQLRKHLALALQVLQLHWLTRRAPFCTATLADPPILSTEPLTPDEHWQPFQARESLLLQAGEVTQRSRHGVRPVPITASAPPAATAQTSPR